MYHEYFCTWLIIERWYKIDYTQEPVDGALWLWEEDDN